MSDVVAILARMEAAEVRAQIDPPVVAAGLTMGEDGLIRCAWADSTPEYRAYHDDAWGQPVRTDDGIYERMTLEAFQSGLAWITILRKRPAFRAAFADFSIARVAEFGETDVARLLALGAAPSRWTSPGAPACRPR